MKRQERTTSAIDYMFCELVTRLETWLSIRCRYELTIDRFGAFAENSPELRVGNDEYNLGQALFRTAFLLVELPS